MRWYKRDNTCSRVEPIEEPIEVDISYLGLLSAEVKLNRLNALQSIDDVKTKINTYFSSREKQLSEVKRELEHYELELQLRECELDIREAAIEFREKMNEI